jgi:hypothetical protein
LTWSTIGPFVAVLLIAFAHAILPQVEKRLGHREPELVSLAGGIAIGYVFLYLLPKIGDYTAAIVVNEPGGLEAVHYRLYAIALLGMLVYYLNDHLNVPHDGRRHAATAIRVTMFALYNFSIGNLLVNVPRDGHVPYLVIGSILALHMLGVDHHLRALYRKWFDQWIRWVLALSVLAGWGVGLVVAIDVNVFAAISAFLAGAVIVNVMTEELPQRDTGRTRFFIGGVAIFAILMTLMRTSERVVIY